MLRSFLLWLMWNKHTKLHLTPAEALSRAVRLRDGPAMACGYDGRQKQWNLSDPQVTNNVCAWSTMAMAIWRLYH